MTWLEIAEAWRRETEGTAHGDLQSKITAFAAHHHLAEGTVRRYASALAFSERLRSAFGLDATHLGAMPLENLQALRRLSRFGMERVRPLVQRLASGELSGGDLRKLEQAARLEAGVEPGPGETSAHAFRLRARLFRERALASYSEAAGGPAFRQFRSPGPLNPLTLDAISFMEGRWGAVRVMPAIETAADPERMKEAFLIALSSARVFMTYTFLVQRRQDADALAELAALAGPCGVGVALSVGDDGWERVLEPERRGMPDLLDRTWKDRLRAVLTDGVDVPGQLGLELARDGGGTPSIPGKS